MINVQLAANVTIILCFVLFLALLVIGAVVMSIPMIVTAFVLGFVGYAILEHETTNDSRQDKAM